MFAFLITRSLAGLKKKKAGTNLFSTEGYRILCIALVISFPVFITFNAGKVEESRFREKEKRDLMAQYLRRVEPWHRPK